MTDKKLCFKCKKNERAIYESGVSSYCIECEQARRATRYSKDKAMERSRDRAWRKETNYSWEKQPRVRLIKAIKRKTRRHFPITENSACAYCGSKAEERHHITQPIQFDKFVFVCKDCHLEKERDKRIQIHLIRKNTIKINKGIKEELA